MHELNTGWALLGQGVLPAWLSNTAAIIYVLIGFSVIIFFHELGHFLAAKWVGVRVHRFAVGFGKRIVGYRKGEGLTFGTRPDYSTQELARRNYGETDYCLNLLPIGGYVKMLGQDDIIIDDKDNVEFSTDPRAFTNRPVGQRMVVVSAGVVFNLLFAAILLMAVYLIGRKMPPAIVGNLAANSPARGKLMEGDRIRTVNGTEVNTFIDVGAIVTFADPHQPMRFQVERGGKVLPEEIVVTPDANSRYGIAELGMAPQTTTEALEDGPKLGDRPNLLKGDRVAQVDGKEVHDSIDILEAFRASGGRLLELKVRRPDPAEPEKVADATCYLRAQLYVSDADLPIEREAETWDKTHLLGFLRRLCIREVMKGRPAEKAGLKPNDLVLEWGGIPNPTHAEMKDVNARNEGRELTVVVMRGIERFETRLAPSRPFKLFGTPEPVQAGISIGNSLDTAGPIVAAVVPGTPAAALNVPRGAKLLTVDGKPVANWIDVAEVLKSAAGREIAIEYDASGTPGRAAMHVPSSFIDELGLPDGTTVYSIDDQKTVKVTGREGKTGEYSLQIPAAIRRYLQDHIGKTVTIRFSRTATGEIEERKFDVRADNIDPWQLRLRYEIDVGFQAYVEMVSAHGNPLKALMMGTNQVKQLVQSVYLTLTKIATHSNAAEQVAGPVGIVSIGMETAKAGTADFLLFLAILSVNLAVINFLPMPVMDGGLMVFLLIEKIKGKPLSFKVQMVTTLVGLAAIILIGLVVTIQDISRFF
ncbi:MAG: site-2 protease family protein [Planctomycetes bacterium]|nr:site-2 protease family protein [Planctomycetota bacterium]